MDEQLPIEKYRHNAYTLVMDAIFIEATSFTASVGDYLTDDEYGRL